MVAEEDSSDGVTVADLAVVVPTAGEVVLGLEDCAEAVEVYLLGEQSNPMLWIPKLHESVEPDSGISKLTLVAPPHWLFETVVPLEEQEVVCLQVEPSGMP